MKTVYARLVLRRKGAIGENEAEKDLVFNLLSFLYYLLAVPL
jgi:hypothetical protein